MHKPPCQFQSDLRRLLKFNRNHQPLSAHLLDEGMFRAKRIEPFNQQSPHARRILYEIFISYHAKRGKTATHSEVVPSKRARMNNSSVKPAENLPVNGPPGNDCTARHKSPAQAFRNSYDVRFK